MNLYDAKIGDVLISEGEGEVDEKTALAFNRIREVQKDQKLAVWRAVHVQVKVFDPNTWESAEEDGVKLHTPTIHPDRHYRLVRCQRPLTAKGILAMQDLARSMVGKEYNHGRLLSIYIQTAAWIRRSWRRWLAKRADGGKDRVVCSGLVYELLRATGIEMPRPRIDPDRRNPAERFLPGEFEHVNNPGYFWQVDSQLSSNT